MKYDYIIPICNADDGPEFEYRLNTIQCLINQFSIYHTPVRFIIIEQIINSNFKSYIDNLTNYLGIAICEKVHFSEYFSKGWLFNIGVNLSKTKNIILAESDISLPHEYFDELNEYLESDPIIRDSWCFGWNNIKYMDEDNKTIIRDTPPFIGGPEGGLVVVDRNYYNKIKSI